MPACPCPPPADVAALSQQESNPPQAASAAELFQQESNSPQAVVEEEFHEEDTEYARFDPNCVGLEAVRADEGVRTLYAHACSAICCWNLFGNSSVNGGYLGKSVLAQLNSRYPDAALRPYSKSGQDYQLQQDAFIAHCGVSNEKLVEVQDLIVQKVQSLPSLRKTLRCINVPERLSQAALVAGAAASAAAREPPKAILDDNLYAKVVLFIKYSQIDPSLGSIFSRYYNNDHSRNRADMDTSGFRSSDLLKQMADFFNDNEGFQEFVDHDDTHRRVMTDVLSVLNPSAMPAPGPIVPDQLIKVINWTRATTTKLVAKYDRSGHLDHGAERLRDMYDNFCMAGPNCADPIDRPKVACYMFAVLGIVFNQANHPAWWNRMLPRGTRCIIGLEGERDGDGEPDSSRRQQQRQRNRYEAMWEGFRNVIPMNAFQDAEPVAPGPQPNLSAGHCIRLLSVLRDGERPQLRTSILDHVEAMLNADIAPPTVLRPRAPPASRERRRNRGDVSSSASSDEEG